MNARLEPFRLLVWTGDPAVALPSEHLPWTAGCFCLWHVLGRLDIGYRHSSCVT